MTRRTYGTGSLYQRASDGRWCATIEAGYTKTGARRRVTVTGKTRGEVGRKLKAKQREIARGEEASARTTVKAWAETWIRQRATVDRPKTHTTDKGAVGYIVAAIGHRRLTDLTPADVRAVDDAVRAEGLSSSTALRYRGTLRRMLKAADAEGHAIPPRVLTVKPPAKAVNDRQAIPTPDVMRLLAVAGNLPHGSRWLAAFLLGLRQGEALGLTWPEVGTDTLTVSWQLQAVPYLDKRDRSKGFALPDGYEVRQLDRRMHLVRPKSQAGSRVLPLLPVLAESLERWRKERPAQEPIKGGSLAVPQARRGGGASVPDYGLVWPALDGRPKEANDDRAEWHRIQAEAKVAHPTGRPYHVHEIRHATATLLLELGVPEAVRVQIMGHSTVASTNAYQHVDVEMAREALTRFAGALELG